MAKIKHLIIMSGYHEIYFKASINLTGFAALERALYPKVSSACFPY